jgi:glycosyltransferase involved in cell wall biosynthesis
MNSAPLVSVLITNYNYAQFLPGCLDSVLRQTYANLQIVVVDDSSTDNSANVLARYQGQIEVIRQPQNRGQAAAFVAGAQRCRGGIICLLDADDFWTPQKVARVVDIFRAMPEVAWLRHQLMMKNEHGRDLGVIPPFRGSAIERPGMAELAERVVTATTSALALRKELADAVLRDDGMRWDADAMLLARCAATNSTGYSLAEVLGTYRRHSQQQYSQHSDVQRLLERQIEVGSQLAQVLQLPQPVSNYKHRLITQWMAGQPILHPRRMRTMLAGLRSAARLTGNPVLFFRQVASVLWATFAPRLWLASLARRIGLP